MSKKAKYVVAVKDISTGKILPGKVLGSFRAEEFARRDFSKLAQRECGWARTYHCGIFFEGKIVSF
ncbi:MAG: hypothetical protein WC517_00150 [Patescibacteria group bacterium]